MLVDAPWDGRDWWSNNVLEVELFSSRECYDRFYILAKEAGALANRDALEVFYICVVLGFRGLYRDPEFSRSTIQTLGLPPDVESWARQAAMSVRLGQGRPQITGKKRDLVGAPPLRGRYIALWSGLALAMAATVLSSHVALLMPDCVPRRVHSRGAGGGKLSLAVKFGKRKPFRALPSSQSAKPAFVDWTKA